MTALHKTTVPTSLGSIVVYANNPQSEEIPVFLLHGIYFDHSLWDAQLKAFADHRVYAIDMPLHGESKIEMNKKWTLYHCSLMLIEVLDFLGIKRTIAVGHSWGSMVILRAAVRFPERFVGIGLCNMPFEELRPTEKLLIHLQHAAILFKKFYMKQAAKALMCRDSLSKNPKLADCLVQSMSKLSIREIIYIDKIVRLHSTNTTALMGILKVPAKALVGEHDYVGKPPIKELKVVNGGHVSPLEAPDEVNNLISDLLKAV